MSAPFVVIAGATGGLGKLVAKELSLRGVGTKALVRPKTDPSRTAELRAIGANIVEVDLSNIPTLTCELIGTICVVSTLQGLKDVIHTAQGNLLDAANAAKVPRFIPSDVSLDFTKTRPGSNRNLDLRREFHARLETSGISWTSILNGGFMDLLGDDSLMVDHKSRKVRYVGSVNQKIEVTTMADTAAYVAALATDPNPAPKFLRIASDVLSAQDIADVESRVYGVRYQPSWLGSVCFLGPMIRILQLFGGQDQILPAWQIMQYMADMFSGAGIMGSCDNDRYPDLKWTKFEDFLQSNKQRSAP